MNLLGVRKGQKKKKKGTIYLPKQTRTSIHTSPALLSLATGS